VPHCVKLVESRTVAGRGVRRTLRDGDASAGDERHETEQERE